MKLIKEEIVRGIADCKEEIENSTQGSKDSAFWKGALAAYNDMLRIYENTVGKK